MSNYNLISNPASLKSLISQLQTQPALAVDTESNSLYSYFERVCLVQISTPTEDYILDPLAVDITPLNEIFSNLDIQKIFHAAEYDIMSLRRDYGFEINNLFDTMVTARILGWSKYGLGDILKNHLDIKLNKQFQQYNWGQRPLSQAALEYAQLDTHYLFQLRDIQKAELLQQGRKQEAEEAFERMTHVSASPKIFNPADFWFIKGAKDLQPDQQSRLQALFVFRDMTARGTNKPPFKIMNDSTLLKLAAKPPMSMKALGSVKGLSPALVRRYGSKLLSLLRQSHGAPLPYPRNNYRRPDEETMQRYEHLRSWRNTTAKARGVEPDVILPNDILRMIAKFNPTNCSDLEEQNILGEWQLKTYGNLIIEQLQQI